MCPSNSAAGRVQIPVGYTTYNAATNKYYKPFNESKTWEGAQLQCNSDGATLIESRTKAEHEVLRWMYGKLSSSWNLHLAHAYFVQPGRLENNEFWTGLVNPGNTKCTSDSQCLNATVDWISDGAPYDHTLYPNHTLIFSKGETCARYRDLDGIKGKGCRCSNCQLFFACEFSCNSISKNIFETE